MLDEHIARTKEQFVGLGPKGKAYCIALLVCSPCASISMALVPVGSRTYSDFTPELLVFSFLYSIVTLPFVAFAGFFVGIPIAAALRKFRIRNLLAWLIVGSLTGGLFSLGLLGTIAGTYEAWAFSIGLLPGFMAALIWWKFAEPKKSDASKHD